MKHSFELIEQEPPVIMAGSNKNKIHRFFGSFPKFPVKKIKTSVTTYDFRTRKQFEKTSSKNINKNFISSLSQDRITHNIRKFVYEIHDGRRFNEEVQEAVKIGDKQLIFTAIKDPSTEDWVPETMWTQEEMEQKAEQLSTCQQ